MQTQSQKIINLVEEIISILDLVAKNHTEEYGHIFRVILKKLNCPHDISQIAREIKGMYAGMGSFNDIVFYNDGKLLISKEEHHFFDKKRSELFDACCEAL